MKYILLLALALVVFSSEPIESVDGILQLSRRNFQQALDENPRLLVKFYIDTCGYCQKMKPVFIDLAQRLKEYGFVLGEVNAHESKSLAAKNGAKGFPTLKLYRDGVSHDFPNSSDSVEMLFEFALQHAYGPITQLETQQDIDLFLKRSHLALLKYSVDNDDLSALAIEHVQVRFGIVNNAQLRAGNQNKYVLYNKDFEKPIFYNGEFDGLSEWITTKGYPLVFSLNEEEFMKVEKEKIPLIGLAGKRNDTLYKRIKYIAESYEGQIRFVTIDPDMPLCNRRFEYLIKKKAIQHNALYYYDYETKKTTTAEYSDDTVGGLKKAIEGLIEEVKRPQREAEKAARLIKGDGEVHTLTKENFKEQVFDNPRHVFVKFYAPWCGHCKSLAPTFEKLAQELNREDIIIAEIDHTQHQIDEVPIEGYPTLYLFKQEGDKKVRVEYEGDRSVSGMTVFLERQVGKKEQQQQEQQKQQEQQDIKNDGTVVQLTSENFEQIVLNSKQDVLVKFYAPWCGHCKAMAEAYKQLAADQGNNQNVLIAEMDWTAHKTSEVDIKGFPTLIFFKKGGEKPQQVKFNSARTAEAMSKFIEENSSFVRKEDL